MFVLFYCERKLLDAHVDVSFNIADVHKVCSWVRATDLCLGLLALLPLVSAQISPRMLNCQNNFVSSCILYQRFLICTLVVGVPTYLIFNPLKGAGVANAS